MVSEIKKTYIEGCRALRLPVHLPRLLVVDTALLVKHNGLRPLLEEA